jgi:DNA-binding NtrC family response regulator
VDDEPSLARWVGTVLERWGYRTSVFADSRAALAAFQAEPKAFHAVVTDQTMPGMTGVDLTREVLALRPDLTVILVTGFSDHVNTETAGQYGVRRCFYKPVRLEQLLAALREARV